jgi:hypothetical protein
MNTSHNLQQGLGLQQEDEDVEGPTDEKGRCHNLEDPSSDGDGFPLRVPPLGPFRR